MVTRLWEQRKDIATNYLKLPPYDAHFNPERIKDNVAYQLQGYVTELTNIFKAVDKDKAADSGDENEDEGESDDWNPMLNREQVLVFLQLIASLLRNGSICSSPRIRLSKDFFKGLLLYENFEVLLCAMEVL